MRDSITKAIKLNLKKKGVSFNILIKESKDLG